MQRDRNIKSYTIVDVIPGNHNKPSYIINYGGSSAIALTGRELNGVIPEKGQRIVLGFVKNILRTIMIDGNKIR